MVTDILKLLNKVIQQKLLPSTKYMFFKSFQTNIMPRFHILCSKCKQATHRLVPEIEKTFICKNKKCGEVNDVRSAKVAFVTFSIEKMLMEILEKNSESLIFPSIENAEKFPIQDTWDGCLHQKVVRQESQFISLCLSTDGVNVYNSTTKSLWPLMVICNNLPTKCRYKLENVVC